MRLQKNILKDKDTFVFELTNLLKKEINYDEKILGKWTELNLPVSLDLNKDEREVKIQFLLRGYTEDLWPVCQEV